MSSIVCRSDIPVKYIDHCGSDRRIAHAAWVLDPSAAHDKDDSEKGWTQVIRAMMRGRHGTPFEHGLLTVYVEAPVVVWWEWTRHRFMALGTPDLGFNLESGRYRVLDGEFYLPPPERPLIEPPEFKPMRPKLVDADDWQRQVVVGEKQANDIGALRAAYSEAWYQYERMLANNISREVARFALGFGLYYAGYVSASPRSWLQFFSLRRQHDRAKFATYPQWEIEQADVRCEQLFADRWPVTYAAFNEFGRMAP